MSRRRPGFLTYARRRWRAVGLTAVLLLGSLLVLALTDRGHDPVWDARVTTPFTVALSDDARIAYDLVANGETIVALEARRGDTGALLWSSPMSDSRALLRAGQDWVAVATDFPRAFLTLYGDDSSVRYQVPLEGNPRAMAGEDERIAVALQGPGNPVLVFDNGPTPTIHSFRHFVNALDVGGGRIAVGTGGGDIVVLENNGTIALNASLPISVRSVSLSADGARLAVGGFNLAEGDLSGLIAYFDLDRPDPLQWTQRTGVGVGIVDMDNAGVGFIAIEEAPPRNVIHAFDVGSPTPRWSRVTDGEIAQDDAGASGGVALSPDGRTLAMGTLRGRLETLSMNTGETLWSYRVDGTTIVTFGAHSPNQFLANARLTTNGPYDGIALFSTTSEPANARLSLLAASSMAVASVTLGLVLGIGYARLRRA